MPPKTKTRTVFVCQQCGSEQPKWTGRCPDCGEWNTFTEQTVTVASRMNDIPRLKLREIVTQYGFSIGDDPRLCESLLRDFCGEQRLEINILVGALKQRVAADLLGSSGTIPRQLLFAQLATRLRDNLGLAPDIALWGVESWAFALDIISTHELSTGTPNIAQHQSAAAGQVQQGYQSTTSAVPSTSSTSATSSEDVLRQAVKVALADGVIADAERAMLSDLAYRLGIPYSVSGQIFSEMEGQAASGTTAGSLATAGKSLRNSNSRGSNAPPSLTVAQTGSCDYTTIGEAILEAEPGTQILVQPGLYRESLDIDKALEIIGNGRLADIVIESPDGSTPCITSSGTGAKVKKVKGLTLRGPFPQYEAQFPLVDVTGGRLAIEDCDIHSGVWGVLLWNKAHLSMTSCIIRDFTEVGIFACGEGQGIIQDCEIYNTPRGVETGDTSTLSMRGCKIHDCTEHGIFACGEGQGIIQDCEIYNTPEGVAIADTSNPTVRGCKIHDCTTVGIFAFGEAQGIIQDCEIYNTPSGVWIQGTSNPTMRGCKIHDCTDFGIVASGKAQGIIQDCEIYNTPYGVMMADTSNPTMRGCKIHDCTGGGIFACDEAQGIIQDCDIYKTPTGVTMTNTSNLSLLDSKIHNCSKYAIEILEQSHGTVENCEIYSNGESGVQIVGTDHLTLLGCMIDDNGGVAPTVRDAYGFKVGEEVQHPKFGEGRVLAVKQRDGDIQVTVLFKSAGTKHLRASTTRLTRM